MTIIPDTPSSLRLTPISRLAAAGRWRVEAMRALREPVLLWFTQGQGRITVAGSTRGYGPNNAVFIPPGTMYGFEMAARVQGSSVFFGRNHGLDLPRTPHFLRPRDPISQKELVAILEAIQRELESARSGSQKAAQHHLGLLGVWMDRQLERERALETMPQRPAAAQQLVARYSSLLERDFRSNRAVADYAEALGVTPTHLTRVCRAETGRTAAALLTERLLHAARSRLIGSQTPVQEIARDLGFGSAAYFTRFVQQHTGQSPTALRRAALPHPPQVA